MLVLARKQNDKLVFPNLGITVHVVRIDNKTVRLGVEAPQDVPVLRHEIADSWTQWQDYPLGQRPGGSQHAFHNRLNAASVGLNLLHRQLETNELQNAEATILRIFRELRLMERELAHLRQEQGEPVAAPPRRALLIEDNLNESELLAGFLRTCNFHVTTAQDDAGALEYLAYEAIPDVVLMDMDLPQHRSMETIRAIRENPKTAGLKIFAVTESLPRNTIARNSQGGADVWIAKPVKPDLLVAEINRELIANASRA